MRGIKRIVLNTTRALAENARRVTEDLREEELLDYDEAICPVCNLAYFVRTGSWGCCADCIGEALERVPSDSLF